MKEKLESSEKEPRGWEWGKGVSNGSPAARPGWILEWSLMGFGQEAGFGQWRWQVMESGPGHIAGERGCSWDPQPEAWLQTLP